LNRVASGLLRIAADFGLLEGKQVREFTSYHLSDEALLYLLHAMNDEMSNARQIINAPDWKMYMMGTEEVERELFRLHQYRQLHYEVAGSLAQLSLPHDTLMDYAESVVL
jgi:DNA-binding transcriptional regulator PaaX